MSASHTKMNPKNQAFREATQFLEGLAALDEKLIKYACADEHKGDKKTAADLFQRNLYPLLRKLVELKAISTSDNGTKLLFQIQELKNKIIKSYSNLLTSQDEKIIQEAMQFISSLYEHYDLLINAISSFIKIPDVIFRSIQQFQSGSETAITASTSQLFKKETPYLWRGKLHSEFNVSSEIVTKLGDEKKTEYFHPKEVYKRFDKLRNFIPGINIQIGNEFKSILTVAAAEDYAPLYRTQLNEQESKEIEQQQLRIIFKHAIVLNNVELVKWFIKNKNEQIKGMLDLNVYVFCSNSLEMLTLLMDSKILLLPKVHLSHASFTSKAKQLEVVNYFLGKIPADTLREGTIFEYLTHSFVQIGSGKVLEHLSEKWNLEFSDDLLHVAASTGDLECYQYVLNKLTGTGVDRGVGVLNNAFHGACCSGNKILVDSFKKPLSEMKIAPLKFANNVVNDAAKSGNGVLTLDLIDKFKNATPDQETLNKAAESGNLDLVNHLIKRYNLVPDQSTWQDAAQSGSVSLVAHLIDSYKLHPDRNTLVCAVDSCSVGLIEYLLIQQNKPEILDFVGVGSSMLTYLQRKVIQQGIKKSP